MSRLRFLSTKHSNKQIAQDAYGQEDNRKDKKVHEDLLPETPIGVGIVGSIGISGCFVHGSP